MTSKHYEESGCALDLDMITMILVLIACCIT